jgi:flavin reductase (DIM6/NTAB) family NADH-FMN oxidoreductase RutF
MGMTNQLARQDVDPAEFRRVIGHWATGVGVVTASGPSGCTVNAITSVSLDPLLLIVCFGVSSSTLGVVRETGRFCINVLGADQHGLAGRFASKDEMSVKFTDVEYNLDGDIPVLVGAIASIRCEVVDEMPAGDHSVMLVRPTGLSTVGEGEPLVFFRSTYHRVHHELPPASARSGGPELGRADVAA